MFWAVAPQGDCSNRCVCSIYGYRGGQVELSSKDPLDFGRFTQDVRYQGRMWVLVDNFDKDLLVFGRGSLAGLYK